LEIYGLLMTYVDDLFITSTPGLMDAIHNKIKETFSLSSPEKISQDPIEFLGMEISNKKCESSGRDAWMITQQSYTKDLIQKEERKLKQKKIPLSRDQALIEPSAEGPAVESVLKPKKLWGRPFTTRARPDLTYAVSRMGASITKAPEAVLKAAAQVKGYLPPMENMKNLPHRVHGCLVCT
jgi:hypothetical protein